MYTVLRRLANEVVQAPTIHQLREEELATFSNISEAVDFMAWRMCAHADEPSTLVLVDSLGAILWGEDIPFKEVEFHGSEVSPYSSEEDDGFLDSRAWSCSEGEGAAS